MRVITRSQWGARSPRGLTRIPGPVRGTTGHYEGPSMGQFSHDQCAGKVKSIQNYHMDTKRWSDIAYNALVCPHGWTFEGRWLGVRSAANGTNLGNDTHYAVCGLWGVGDPMTDDAKREVSEVFAYFDANGAGEEWKGHRDWKATQCPGDEFYDWITSGHPAPGIQPPPLPDGTDWTPTDKAIAFTDYGGGRVYTFAADGGVFAENLPFFGSLGGVRINAPIVWGEGIPSADGYYLVGADGGIFCFGNARQVNPYTNLFAEYASGQRRITSVQRTESGLILLSNYGERYAL